MPLKNHVAIVTGAGAGIGKATALLFAIQGAKVCCNSLSGSAISTVERIKSQGGEAFFCQGDVSDPDTAQKIVNEAIEKYHKINILFNNAGIVIPGGSDNTLIEDWDRTMKVNVRSVFLVSKFALPFLRQTKGCIINNASCIALKGTKNRLAYAASKGAILSMSKAMAMDCIEFGVRVNCICPGTVDSPSLRQRIADSNDPEATRAQFITKQPSGRIGSAEEIAEGVLFLVNATYCVGMNLSMDGGLTA